MKTSETLDQPEKGNFHLQKMILFDKNQGSRIDEVNDFKLGSIESNDHDEKNSNITKTYKGNVYFKKLLRYFRNIVVFKLVKSNALQISIFQFREKSILEGRE